MFSHCNYCCLDLSCLTLVFLWVSRVIATTCLHLRPSDSSSQPQLCKVPQPPLCLPSTEDMAKSFRYIPVPLLSYLSRCVIYKCAELSRCFQKLPSIVSLWLLASLEGQCSVHGLESSHCDGLSPYGKDVCQLLIPVLFQQVALDLITAKKIDFGSSCFVSWSDTALR